MVITQRIQTDMPYFITVWSDPFWDGAGCVADTAHSCDRYGWFHREIEPTQDDIRRSQVVFKSGKKQ